MFQHSIEFLVVTAENTEAGMFVMTCKSHCKACKGTGSADAADMLLQHVNITYA